MNIKDQIKDSLAIRINFVINDAKTYIFVRKEGLLEKEGIGGGNFSTAHSLFFYLTYFQKSTIILKTRPNL